MLLAFQDKTFHRGCNESQFHQTAFQVDSEALREDLSLQAHFHLECAVKRLLWQPTPTCRPPEKSNSPSSYSTSPSTDGSMTNSQSFFAPLPVFNRYELSANPSSELSCSSNRRVRGDTMSGNEPYWDLFIQEYKERGGSEFPLLLLTKKQKRAIIASTERDTATTLPTVLRGKLLSPMVKINYKIPAGRPSAYLTDGTRTSLSNPFIEGLFTKTIKPNGPLPNDLRDDYPADVLGHSDNNMDQDEHLVVDSKRAIDDYHLREDAPQRRIGVNQYALVGSKRQILNQSLSFGDRLPNCSGAAVALSFTHPLFFRSVGLFTGSPSILPFFKSVGLLTRSPLFFKSCNLASLVSFASSDDPPPPPPPEPSPTIEDE